MTSLHWLTTKKISVKIATALVSTKVTLVPKGVAEIPGGVIGSSQLVDIHTFARREDQMKRFWYQRLHLVI